MADKSHADASKPTDAKSLDDRRRALRNILAGSGVVAGASSIPGTWTKPVVDGVLLPAHAQTTSGRVSLGGGIGFTFTSNEPTGGLLDSLIGQAHAGGGPDILNGCIEITFDQAGGMVTDLEVAVYLNDGTPVGSAKASVSTKGDGRTSFSATVDGLDISGKLNESLTKATGTVANGGVYDFTADLDGAKLCPNILPYCEPGYYFDEGRGTCYPTPTCAPGSYFDEGRGVCYANPTTTE